MAKDIMDPVADRLAQLDALIEEQKKRLAQSGGGGMTADQLQAVLTSVTAGQKEIADASRTVTHSNPNHEHKSAFSYPEGDLKRPKPKLQRETYLNGHREAEDDLTPAEIDAYNAITHSCEARDGRWTAVVKGKRLIIDVPSKTPDDRMDLPNGLVLILLELAKGKRAADPMEMAARIAALEKAAEQAGIVIPA